MNPKHSEVKKLEIRKAWETLRDAIHEKDANSCPNWETIPVHILERVEMRSAKALRRLQDIADYLGTYFD